MVFTATQLSHVLDKGKGNSALSYGANTGLRARKRKTHHLKIKIDFLFF